MDQIYQQPAYMPEDKERIIRAGIALFELRVPYQYYFDKTIMGPYNCVVEEYVDPGRPPRMTVNWITNINAGIRYNADTKTGNCIAWMPDDPWMHNRIVLLGNPKLNVVMRHSPREGIVPGRMIQIELQAIKNTLFTQIPIWKVMKSGVEKCFFYNEKDAKEEMEDLRNVALKMDSMTGVMKAVAQTRTKLEVVKGNLPDYKPEIKQIIQRGMGLQYGWTSDEEFTKKWRPMIARELTKLKEAATPARAVAGSIKPKDLVEAMADWTPEEHTNFRAMMADMMTRKEDAPAIEEKVEEVN